MIVWDTVRSDHLSVYGYERNTTPYLAKLVKDNYRQYKEVISVSPWTLPSHASMFTGLYPRSHGAHHFYRPSMDEDSKDYRPLSGHLETLAERLNKQGYDCAGVSANYGMAGRNVNMQQGFNYFCDKKNPLYLKAGHVELPKKIVEALQDRRPVSWRFPFLVPFMTAEQVNEQALQWLENRENHRPFFMFLNYMDPHTPYYYPSELHGLFEGFKKELQDSRPNELLCRIGENECFLTVEEKAHIISQYDTCIYYLDTKIKEFEKALREKDLYEDTMVVLVSDHGEALGEHKLVCHIYSLYNELMRVPLIVKYPQRSGVKSSEKVKQNKDVFNMILRQAGLYPESSSEEAPWQAVAERYQGRPRNCECLSNELERAVYFDKYKYISSSKGEEELFNLSTDPKEIDNILSASPPALKKGRELLREFLDTVPQASKLTQPDKLTPSEKKTLRALGYIY